MNQEMIISIIKATAGSLDSLISQVAWMLAVQAAAHYLSVTLPLVLVGSILLRLAATEKGLGNHAKAGSFILAAWVLFAGSLFTGVRGVAPLAQAALSPSVYVAMEAGDILKLIKEAHNGAK